LIAVRSADSTLGSERGRKVTVILRTAIVTLTETRSEQRVGCGGMITSLSSASLEQRARGTESCFLRSCPAEGFNTQQPTLDLVLRRNCRARTSSAYLHFATARPPTQGATTRAWESGQAVLGVGCMPPISRRGHARPTRMKNRTMFAKPVDVSDAPQRVAGRRW